MNTATAPSGACDVTLPVYEAFGEAGHLAVAAGTAATGLALIGLARAAAKTRLWPNAATRMTAVAGAVLVAAAVIGPVSVPVYVLWLLTVSILLLRPGTTSGTSVGGAQSSAPSRSPKTGPPTTADATSARLLHEIEDTRITSCADGAGSGITLGAPLARRTQQPVANVPPMEGHPSCDAST